MTLALKYRPQQFSDVIGQRLNAVVLSKMIENDTVPPALLFSGPYGTGKTSTARILAMELNPDEREAILNEQSLSVIEIDAASNGKVEDIRKLIDTLRYSVGTEHRVVILDEAHSITREGFNALLKTLEEPPDGVVFIFVTTAPQKLPDTILSRLIEFEFQRIGSAVLLERIKLVAEAEGIEIDDALAQRLAENADGSARDALNSLDFVARAEVTTLEKYLELTGERDGGPMLLAAMLSGDQALVFKVVDSLLNSLGDPRRIADDLIHTIRDLFILQAGGELHVSGKQLEHRRALAGKISSSSLHDAIDRLWKLKTVLRAADDQRANLELALIVATRAIAVNKVDVRNPVHPPGKSVSSNQEPARELSLSEMQQS